MSDLNKELDEMLLPPERREAINPLWSIAVALMLWTVFLLCIS